MVTVAGIPVISLALVLPRVGAWHADVEIATEQLDGGANLTVTDGTNSFVGVALRSGQQGAHYAARVVGGSGGLSSRIPAAHYREARVRLLVEEILRDAGEQLSPGASGVLLDLEVPAWSRPPLATAGGALSAIAGLVGAVWRVLPDGTVWFGEDEFDEPFEPIQTPELTQDAIDGTYVIATETMDLRPGITFVGRRISRVVHTVTDGTLRTRYWAE